MLRLLTALGRFGLLLATLFGRGDKTTAAPRRLFENLAGPDGRERTMFKIVGLAAGTGETPADTAVRGAQRPAPRPRGWRLAVVAVSVPVVALAAALGAIAYFTTSGTGNGLASVGTLDGAGPAFPDWFGCDGQLELVGLDDFRWRHDQLPRRAPRRSRLELGRCVRHVRRLADHRDVMHRLAASRQLPIPSNSDLCHLDGARLRKRGVHRCSLGHDSPTVSDVTLTNSITVAEGVLKQGSGYYVYAERRRQRRR